MRRSVVASHLSMPAWKMGPNASRRKGGWAPVRNCGPAWTGWSGAGIRRGGDKKVLGRD